MIRLIQRRLIIPRGDTGSFSIPVIKNNTDNIAVFTIFDETTKTRMFQKMIQSEGDVINIAFTHSDTVNLKPGKYVWDIKYYSNPEFIDDELVNGEEVDSYYAGFSLPVCEIRETADNYLVSPDAPDAKLSPEQLEIVTGAIHSLNEAIRKTQENVEHYPEIRDEVWYVWDAELSDYVSTGVRANGIVGNGIASAVLNDDYTLTLNFTDGTSFTSPSIRGETGNGIDDIVLNNDFTLTISYTDGESYTTPSIRGPIGATPQFSIGTVQDGAVAAASITGTAENPVLNLTLPNAHVPTKVSQLENDAGYLTEHQDLSDYVKNTDYATENKAGVIKINNSSTGLAITPNGTLRINPAANDQIKAGANGFQPIQPGSQHSSTFYGLARAAGDTTQSKSSNTVGTYTNEAKAAIQQMLDVPSNVDIPTQVSELTNDAGYLTTETDPTVPAWAKAAQKPSYTAAEVGAPTVAEMNTAIGTAIGQINSFDIAVVQELPTQDISTHTIYLIPKTGETNDVYDEYVYINDNWEMVGNTQIDLSNYVQKTDYATSSKAGIIKIPSDAGLTMFAGQYLVVAPATLERIKTSASTPSPITTSIQHASAFYGLAKAAGDNTQSSSDNPIGTYTDEAKAAIQSMLDVPSNDDIPDVPVQDVQINGVSVLSDGVANVPLAGSSSFGVVKVYGDGLYIGSDGRIRISPASSSRIKEGTIAMLPIDVAHQYESTFYGLAKAAGDTTQSQSNNAVGQYTDEAKAAIQTMLDVPAKSDIPDVPVQDVQVNGVSVLADGVANVPMAIVSGEQIGSAKIADFYMNGKTWTQTASAPGAVALGFNVAATSNGAFAEGAQTTASGTASHAEGMITKALGDGAHAEGRNNTASAPRAHAEGQDTEASAYQAHSEGFDTLASGINSHAEGTGTIANSYSLHVGGAYNVENSYAFWPEWASGTEYTIGDKVKVTVEENGETVSQGYICKVANNDSIFTTSKWTTDYYMDFAEIIGNGTDDVNRSNARALEWNGNEHLAGDLYIQCNSDSTGGKKVATINDILVQDVQVNGTSVVTDGVANVPVASYNDLGVVKVSGSFGLGMGTTGANAAYIRTYPATSANIKSGGDYYRPITPNTQHESAFYGLAKAAGADMKDIANTTVGIYPDAQKEAIQSMLGISQMLAPENPNLVATQAYAIGDVFAANGHLYKATAAIAQDGAIIPDINCVETTMVDESVRDVQIEGNSIVGSDGVASIPFMYNNSGYGLTKIRNSDLGGLHVDLTGSAAGALYVDTATEVQVKSGTQRFRAITPIRQHVATFYGLSKVAGVDLANETVTLGTYTPEAKGAIQSMLGVSDLIATAENTLVASKAYAIGDVFTANGKLYKATAAIAADAAIITDGANANCEETNIGEGFVKFTDYATTNTAGVALIYPTNGINIDANGRLITYPSSNELNKVGSNWNRPIVPAIQHSSVFYGLAKAAGADEKDSTLPIGQYTDTAKSAIRTMLGAVGSEDYATESVGGVVKINPAWGIGLYNGTLLVNGASADDVKAGNNSTKAISAYRQHQSTFYGLAKAAGDTTQAQSDNAVGTYTDDAKAAIRTMLGAVGSEDVASTTNFGLIKIGGSYCGLTLDPSGYLKIVNADSSYIKTGTDLYKPIVPGTQHNSVFYGLAKAAGDTTQSASSNAVGTYTDNAKASIKSMLGIVDGSTGTVDVTGAAPTITAVENTRYVCGEVTSLNITPAANGICIVRFTSGSTPTVLTLPSTVKFPEWFDPTSLETDTIYEMCITDGIYGAVMSWAL